MLSSLYLEHLSDSDLAFLGAAGESRYDVRRAPLEALIDSPQTFRALFTIPGEIHSCEARHSSSSLCWFIASFVTSGKPPSSKNGLDHGSASPSSILAACETLALIRSGGCFSPSCSPRTRTSPAAAPWSRPREAGGAGASASSIRSA